MTFFSSTSPSAGRVWITFYRAWHQTSDLAVVDALAERLITHGLEVSAFYAYSLREPEAQEELLRRKNEAGGHSDGIRYYKSPSRLQQTQLQHRGGKGGGRRAEGIRPMGHRDGSGGNRAGQFRLPAPT